MHEFLSIAVVFVQVVLIDLVLAGDNAIVVGMAAAGLPPALRRKAIIVGIGAATVLRIGLALCASMLLDVIGLKLAGGLLLLWVCWKLFGEMYAAAPQPAVAEVDGEAGASAARRPPKPLKAAVWQIVVADLSMSIDNVLAVSGAAEHHPIALIFGLALSVLLMGLAASWMARLLDRWRWIGYLGLVVIVAVALGMIYRGGVETMSVHWPI
jgi:YjbE family integral membrane protein